MDETPFRLTGYLLVTTISSTHAEAIPIVTATRRPGWRRFNYLPYLLALPILAYEAIFILYPIYQGVASSFTKQTTGKPATWVGLANYSRLLDDENFWHSVQRTIVYMVSVIIVAIGFGLGSALLLNRPFHGRTAARATMTLPWAFPDVPTVLVFIWILNPNFGVANRLTGALPFVDEHQMWLLDPKLAMPLVVLITAWKGFPFYSLVILAALQTVPHELTEAARVDGANKVQAFWAVTLPSISPTLLLLTVLAAIFSFKQFTLVYLLTGGGPGDVTDTLVIRIYQTAFRFHNFPYAATIGVASFFMVITIALIFLAVQRYQEGQVS
jgi:multiple sugar transport system permease protein